MITMRAKMRVTNVKSFDNCEDINMTAVTKLARYSPDSLDEDNTFSQFTPHAELTLTVANAGLLGKINLGSIYYLDFTQVQND